jgi:hypothetical protein
MIAIAVGYFASLGVRVKPPANRTNLSIEVADINSLVVDSNVLLRGKEVGKVTTIKPSVTGVATVGFYIDGRYQIPVDSDIRVENLSALGETYIALVPQRPGGPFLRDGQRIGTERVKQPASISELAESTVRVLNQADPDALKRIVGEADVALPDPNAVLPNLSRTSMLLRNVAADMHGRGSALLDNFQTLLQNAGWVGPLLAKLGPGVRNVGLYGDLALAGIQLFPYWGAPAVDKNFNALFDRIQKLLDTNGGDLKVLGKAFLPHLKGLAGALMNFDTGQILTNLLATVPEDGAITLHVAVPKGN